MEYKDLTEAIILELKSVRRVVRAHGVQVVNYLVATGKPIGLILNFGDGIMASKRC
ncbi:MAG: GxxExxY protein [Pseudomonadota bacterium]